MNVCDRICPELKAYADGQVSALSRLTIRWHLARCADCRREAREMEQISRELHEENEALAPALRARILAALPESQPDTSYVPSMRPRWQRPAWILSGLATAALAMLFFLPRIGLWGGEDSAPASSNMAANAPSASSPAGKQAMPGSAGGPGREAMKPADSDTSQYQKSAERQPALAMRATENTAIPPIGRPADKSGAGMPMASSPSGSLGSSRSSPGASFGGVVPSGGKGSFGSQSDAKTPAPPAEDEPAASRQNLNGQPKNAPAMASPMASQSRGVTKNARHEAALTLLVADVEIQAGEIERIGKAAHGSVTLSRKTQGTPPGKDITLSIPVAQFESVRRQIARLGEAQSEKLENKRAEAALRLQTLKQSAEQATILVHLTERPEPTSHPIAPGK